MISNPIFITVQGALQAPHSGENRAVEQLLNHYLTVT
jgi:hypothetical protein